MQRRDGSGAPPRPQVGFAVGALLLTLLDAWIGSPARESGVQQAYIDPGAGSFVVQALIAVLAGAAVTVRAYWSRIKALFGAKPAHKGEPGSGEPPSGDE